MQYIRSARYICKYNIRFAPLTRNRYLHEAIKRERMSKNCFESVCVCLCVIDDDRVRNSTGGFFVSAGNLMIVTSQAHTSGMRFSVADHIKMERKRLHARHTVHHDLCVPRRVCDPTPTQFLSMQHAQSIRHAHLFRNVARALARDHGRTTQREHRTAGFNCILCGSVCEARDRTHTHKHVECTASGKRKLRPKQIQ